MTAVRPAFEGIEQGEADDGEDGGDLTSAGDAQARVHGAEDDREDDRKGEDSNSFGEGAQDQKRSGGEAADPFAEAAAHEFVSGEDLAAEIEGQEDGGDDDAGEQVAENQLEEAEVAGEGKRRGADDSERAGLGRDDREGDRPPGSRIAAEEIIAEAALALPEARSKPCDAGKVGGDHRPIDGVHERTEDSTDSFRGHPSLPRMLHC